MSGLKDIAFYYPGHLWSRPDWVKTLLVFFDGVGLLVPEYKVNEPERVDPVLAGPLKDKGLLHYLFANEVVNNDATESLAAALGTLIASGAFDSLTKHGSAFHTLSMSRMGYFGNERLAEQLLEKLKARNLARDSEDGASIPMHPVVRYTILVMLAQILRPQGRARGLDLSPATDRPDVVKGLTELLNLPTLPSAGQVIAFDLQNVSVDLSSVPLDEVLDFRHQNLAQHRDYIIAVRRFARELSLMPSDDRPSAFEDRQVELDDLAADLRRKARAAWKAPVTFGIGLAGAAWSYTQGHPMGAVFSAASTLLRGARADTQEAGAYSYLFAAGRRYA